MLSLLVKLAVAVALNVTLTLANSADAVNLCATFLSVTVSVTVYEPIGKPATSNVATNEPLCVITLALNLVASEAFVVSLVKLYL